MERKKGGLLYVRHQEKGEHASGRRFVFHQLFFSSSSNFNSIFVAVSQIVFDFPVATFFLPLALPHVVLLALSE
jgi:hypothetical protein